MPRDDDKSVKRRRKRFVWRLVKRGIASFKSKHTVNWKKQPLGEMPDKMLAMMIGVNPNAVTKARIEHGIPCFRPKKNQWSND